MTTFTAGNRVLDTLTHKTGVFDGKVEGHGPQFDGFVWVIWDTGARTATPTRTLELLPAPESPNKPPDLARRIAQLEDKVQVLTTRLNGVEGLLVDFAMKRIDALEAERATSPTDPTDWGEVVTRTDWDAAPFKVGDKVRVVKHHTDGTQHDKDRALCWTGEIGTEGVICRISDGSSQKLYSFRTASGKGYCAFVDEIKAVRS